MSATILDGAFAKAADGTREASGQEKRRCHVCNGLIPVAERDGVLILNPHGPVPGAFCPGTSRPWRDPVEHEAEREINRRKGKARADAKAVLSRELVVTTAADIKPRRVRWAWENRVPLGGLTLIAGRESGGKSTVAYERAARITRGDLEGEMYGTPKSVVVVATEDSWEHTIVPRLMAARADRSRVLRVGIKVTDFGSYELSLPEDIPALEDVFKKYEVALVVLDPLMSRIGRKADGRELDTHKDSDVRAALEPLVALADRSGVTVLGIIHVNKSGSTDPLTSVMGSRAFAAVARAVLFVVRDGDDRVLCFPKSNLGPEQPSIKFRVEGVEVAKDDDGKPIVTAKVEWGEEDRRSARDVLEEQLNGRRTSTKDKATDWLWERLSSGPVASKLLVEEAEKLGISRTALARARKELGNVIVETSGFPKQTTWALPVGDL